MRFSESSYPTYSVLEKNNLTDLKIDQMFGDMLPNENKLFGFLSSINALYRQVNKRYYLTNTFKEAINTALPKIQEKNKHLNDIPSDCGIIFTDKGFTLYLSNPTDKMLKLLVYGFTKDCLTTYGYMDNDGAIGGMAANAKDGVPFNDTQHLSNYISTVLTALYFIHNCETEQTILSPNQRLKEHGNKHINETNSKIIVLDCRWFTELIRDTKFSVEGHLRWQVHGERNTKRKLIWIAGFEKHGYHRRATSDIINP